MNYKPEESTLISYLYGELSGEQKKKVEEYLSGNKEAGRELEELKSALSIMNELKDKEVDIPTFTFDQPTKVIAGSAEGYGFWRRSMAIAASIALVLFIGYLTKFSASYTKDGFEVAFGNSTAGYSQEEVKQMITDAIERNNADFSQKLARSEDGMRTYISDQNESLQSQLVNQRNNPPQSESSLEYQRREYLSQLKQLLEDSELSQKQYTDQALTDFAVFLDIQRQNDMQVIQTRFNNLEDNTELNRFKTDQLISNLISNEDPNQY